MLFAVENETGICNATRDQTIARGLLDDFIPECDANAYYQRRQCYGFLNQCWCVDKMTGQELEGSRKSEYNPTYDINCENYIGKYFC